MRIHLGDRVRSTRFTCVGEIGTVVDAICVADGKRYGKKYFAVSFDSRIDEGAVWKSKKALEVVS